MDVATLESTDVALVESVVMVNFEGTTMSYDELSRCVQSVLHEYAVAYDMLKGNFDDDIEARVTWAIKLTIVKYCSDARYRLGPTKETRQAAAATFRDFIVRGGCYICLMKR